MPGAHICLHYYAGFAYMMLRRYADAAVCFNNVRRELVTIRFKTIYCF